MSRNRESESVGRQILFAANIVVAVSRSMHLSGAERVQFVTSCLDKFPSLSLRSNDSDSKSVKGGQSEPKVDPEAAKILSKFDDAVRLTQQWCYEGSGDQTACWQVWQKLSASILKYFRMTRPDEVWASASRRAQLDSVQELLYDVCRGHVPRIDPQAAIKLIDASERRRHERVELDVPIIVWLRNRPMRCTTTDVSVRGCKVNASFDIATNEDIVVQFATGLRVPSQVAWCSIEAIGVKFRHDVQISRLVPAVMKI